jgi:hypothetical protein
MKSTAVFWDVTPYSPVDVHISAFQRNVLRATSGSKSKPSKQQRNAGGHLPDYTARSRALHEVLILLDGNATKYEKIRSRSDCSRTKLFDKKQGHFSIAHVFGLFLFLIFSFLLFWFSEGTE